MSDTVSFADLDGQHVELLPARTVLSLFNLAAPNGGTGGAGGAGIGGTGANVGKSNFGGFQFNNSGSFWGIPGTPG